MKITKLIFGIICFVLAAALTVAILTLPQSKLMFMVGDINMPWVPAVTLAILGIVLISSAVKKPDETKQEAQLEHIEDPEKRALDKRIETIGWGCFLIMLGGFALVPHEMVPKGSWSIGLGVLLIGLNVFRAFNQVKMNGFTTFLGVLSLVFGITDILGGPLFMGQSC